MYDPIQIGDFRIERPIGAGGMGIVYLARQVSLDRLVALKMLGQSLTRQTAKQRFKREAQAFAKLNHANIASIFFVGQDVREPLQNIVHKATAKDPDHRYQSASEFSDDLNRFLNGMPVSAPKYRCQLDQNEIRASRPEGVVYLAFIVHLTGMIAVIFAGLALIQEIGHSEPLRWLHVTAWGGWRLHHFLADGRLPVVDPTEDMS